MMELSKALLRNIEADLSINAPYSKGVVYPVRNCWHFSTDGNRVDQMFLDNTDFIDGMNRIFVVVQKYQILILAFVLMDTHVHFILYGNFDQCNRFMHEYLRRTSMNFSSRHGDRNKFADVPVNHQEIDDDQYLKKAICYVLRNPLAAGLPFNYYDYPWSSGALYFRRGGLWNSPFFCQEESMENLQDLGFVETRELLKSHINDFAAASRGPVSATASRAPVAVPASSVTRESKLPAATPASRVTAGSKLPAATPASRASSARVINGLVYPGDYVEVEIGERIFKTPRGFHYFMSKTKEEDVEARGGAISRLSIPLQEMRQNRNALCEEMFGHGGTNRLDTAQRLRLAKALRSRYNSSPKQIAKLCGLIYDEVKDCL